MTATRNICAYAVRVCIFADQLPFLLSAAEDVSQIRGVHTYEWRAGRTNERASNEPQLAEAATTVRALFP